MKLCHIKRDYQFT